MSKQDAREQALGLLYAVDLGPDSESVEPTGRAGRLAAGVQEHLSEIDAEIDAHSTGWRITRMPAVDRTILRIAVYELKYTDTPVGVVVSEAVELAKRYSTAKSGSFVNGVLASVATDRT
ncbi:MAG: transcription antitermination factor NusB [Actinomycetota bacterium]|nr:transcription antitermination factor NusB [Actinomycetota bacterium]